MDVNALPSLKQNIRQLKKEKAEILTTSRDSEKAEADSDGDQAAQAGDARVGARKEENGCSHSRGSNSQSRSREVSSN